MWSWEPWMPPSAWLYIFSPELVRETDVDWCSGLLRCLLDQSKVHTNAGVPSDSNREMEVTQLPLVDEGLNKIWHISTMEYYSDVKKKEILSRATTWIKFGHYTKWYKPVTKEQILIPFTWISSSKQIHKDRK